MPRIGLSASNLVDQVQHVFWQTTEYSAILMNDDRPLYQHRFFAHGFPANSSANIPSMSEGAICADSVSFRTTTNFVIERAAK